jgi:hypothetical protein
MHRRWGKNDRFQGISVTNPLRIRIFNTEMGGEPYRFPVSII